MFKCTDEANIFPSIMVGDVCGGKRIDLKAVMFKGTMTKWPVQKLAQGTTQKLLQHHDATDI